MVYQLSNRERDEFGVHTSLLQGVADNGPFIFITLILSHFKWVGFFCDKKSYPQIGDGAINAHPRFTPRAQ